MNRALIPMLFAAVLAACEAPPRAPRVDPVPAPAPEPLPPPAPPEPPPAPAGPVSADAQKQAQKLALAAVDLLQAGNEDGARAEIKRALALDPQNKLALSLTRQMTVDPAATLGRESFSYTVRPGDSLAELAKRQLGDPYLFYLLARYNDIKVPKQLSAGQVVRLPGKAMAAVTTAPTPRPAPPVAPTPPAPAPPAAAAPPPPPPAAPPPPPLSPGEQAMNDGAAAERAGDLPRALAAYRKADTLGQSGAAGKVDQMRALLVNRYTVAARNAFTKQDLDGAIANWQRVLDLDPNNTTARSEQERAKALKVKLGGVK